jgi:hypothetical protein
MRFLFGILLLVQSLTARAELNVETYDFTFESGHAYRSVSSEQKANKLPGPPELGPAPLLAGRVNASAGATVRVRFFGGYHLLRFNEPPYGTLDSEFDSLNIFGLELLLKTGPVSKIGVFGMQQDHPLYRATGPTTFEVLKRKFGQTGVHFQLGQRRRVGLL